jgi:hypothetical protein
LSTTWQWLMAPLSGAPQHVIEPWAYWHARCMVAGWGVMLPLGALLARYFKVPRHADWPRVLDHKAWWHGHRALQWGGVLVMSAGAALAWGHGHLAGSAALAHAWLGWTVIALGWLQVAAGLVRGSKGGPTSEQLRGDHYDMTAYRVWFERLHKGLGWLAIAAAVLVLVLGLLLADAPRWMALVLASWWLGLGAAAWHWQRQGRCIDTYQAIWGPDPRHPGNHKRPIGWGVRRLQNQAHTHG